MWFLFLWAAIVVVTDALPNKPYLLYSNLTNVGAIDLKTHVRTDVIAGLHNVIPLDVDNVQNKLYYGEAALGNIYRSDMDGSNRENILTNIGQIEGVAVDWVGRSIYWTSYTSEKIMVATLDGRHRKVLVNTGLEYPRGLAVDPRPSEGYLFWTDWGFAAAVERSTLSGGDRKILVDKNITWPNGVTLDYPRKRVYWIDAFHDTITSIDYDGGQRTTIFEDMFLDVSKFHGFDLDTYRDTIYWSDWSKNAIFAVNITTSKIITNVSIPTRRYSHGVMGVVIVDLLRQPAASNPCGSNNGGCQHLCLLEPNNNFKCECEIGTKLDQDGKSCIDAFKDEFLMFADADAAKIYQLQTDEINVEPVPIKFMQANLRRPVSLEFDPVEDRVYWTDVTREIICRAFRNGSGYEEIVTENVGVADGLTIDLAGRNLYWTSTTHNTIEVSRFDGSSRRELINSFLDEPRDIIVDPIAGYMYWTDWGLFAKIERASMDGSNRTEVVNNNIRWPNGLTIDHVYDKLYWADAYEDSIEILELITGRRNVIINEKILIWGSLYRLTTEVNHPYGLTLLNEFIYWTDWRSDSVYRAQINTGAEITLLASNLGKPMDIHAYNINQTQQYKKTYTFSFPKTGSNFTCIRNRTCPPMDPAPPCPAGYKTSRVNQTCGLNCRNIVGYTWRCPCRNWQECAVRERYFYGCASGYYSSYNVRECVQIVKVGRCPYKNKGSVPCINDEACSGTQKCCNSNCTEPATIATHPCQKNNGDCGPGQLCLSVPGGHRCKCGSGLIFNVTKQECEVDLLNKPYLLYSSLTNIDAIDLKNYVRTKVISGVHNVIPLGVDNVQNKLYYGEAALGHIYRSDMDGSNRENILTDIGLIEGVAVDWVGRSIYWTSYTSEKIMVATLEGNHRKILVNTGLEYPRGLAVDPSAGYLFWTDWGFAAAVERSTLSGGDRKILVDKNITWPNGMTLDYSRKRVYWIDAFHDTITSIDYDGGQRTTIFEDVFLDVSKFHGFDLDTYHDIIYWSDWSKNAIFAVNITTSKIITNVSIPTRRYSHGVMGVVIVDPSRQPAASNPCGSNNGGCQHLCLLEPNNNFKCECEIGTKLDQDGKSCIDAFKDEFLMFADADAAKIYQLQTDEINVEPVPIKFIANLSRPVALEFDPVEDRVYWTDVTRKIICRAFRNGSGYEEIVTENVGVADGLTIDLAGRNLYWTSTTHNTIEVSRFDGSLRRELINKKLYEPRDIIVDPIGGSMYWTDWGISKIERASMDGSNRTELVNKNIRWPNGLTIDHVYDKLYWADAYEDSIEILELKTGRRNVIINEKIIFGGYLYGLTTQVNHPYGLTLLHEFIYWTDWRSDSVYRAQINTGAEITLLASNLGRPMDIHAYNINQTQQYKKTYTFSFPKTGSNFTCIRNRTCPPMDPAPPCPAGYKTSRVNQTCGLYCRNIVGYTWRCPCRNWQECAVRERYFYGCGSGYYSSYNVRECVQIVKVGRCPYKNKGSVTCINDEACSGTQKCCNSKCTEPATIATHPCQKNNGDCGKGQLCLSVPGGHRCECGTGLMFNVTKQQCEGCRPPQAPANGSFSGKCASTSELLPYYSRCTVICTKGYKVEEGSFDFVTCLPDLYWGSVPKCIVIPNPVFSHCPTNIISGTDPGVATRVVNWTVPTALDHEKHRTTVTVKPSHFVPPMKFAIGVFNVEYQTQDKDYRTSTCRFSITIKDLEPPSFGDTCPKNIIKYVDTKDDVIVPWTEPTAKDNVGVVGRVQKSNVTSKYPVGKTTSVSYIARDAAGLTATCLFTIRVINVCDGAPCGFGAACVLRSGNSYKCVCGSACTLEHIPVCGSDGKNYVNQCNLQLASCTQQKNITVAQEGNCPGDCTAKQCPNSKIPVCGSNGKTYENKCKLDQASCVAKGNFVLLSQEKCGCDGLKMDADDKASNTVNCTLVNNVFACKVTCNKGYDAPLPGFLNLQCNNNKWIRGNNHRKYVPVNKSPPTCYKTVSTSNGHCSSGSEILRGDLCVPCPPGSYSEAARCQACKATEYQDEKGQTSCKSCKSSKSSKTSLTTGAESCYFNHGGKKVDIVFKADKTHQYSQDDLRKELAKALTDFCSKNTCSFKDNNTSSRRKRDAVKYKFDEDHIIIVSVELINDNKGRKVVVFVLDPTSTERIPTKAFSSEHLKNLLLKLLQIHQLHFFVESVSLHGETPGSTSSPGRPGSTSSSKKSSADKSKAGLIAGVTLGILCLIAVAVAIFMFTRRRKQKSQFDISSAPSVQFSQESGGRVIPIGGPVVVPDNYENPDPIDNGVHSFENQVYNEVNQPPPYYATTPISNPAAAATASPDQSHIYETPAGAQGWDLPEKKPLPDDGVVDLIPMKQGVYLSKEKSPKVDMPVMYSKNRVPENVYSLPRGEQPRDETATGAEGSLKLDPPPKYDDAKLRIIRDQTASSVLPNVPRTKDTNDNERGTTRGRDNPRGSPHELRDVTTKEQSES